MKSLTLAQFKREINSKEIIGLELLERYGEKVVNPKVVYISKIQTNGIYLKREKGESFLDYPSASLFYYDGEYVKIYNSGTRELNELEKSVLKRWGSITETEEYKRRAEIDMMTDSNSTYYQEKKFFMNSPCPYLFLEDKGLRYLPRENLILDPKVKGRCILVYRVYRRNV